MSLKLTLALGAFLGLAPLLPAEIIEWGSSFGSTLAKSNGDSLDSTFKFELGKFANGFTPNAGNTSLWTANWISLDTASTSTTPATFDPSVGWAASTATLNSNTVFQAGDIAYIWAFDTRGAGQTAEWALITNHASVEAAPNAADDWTYPLVVGSHNTPQYFRLANSSTPVLGGLNSFRGPGSYTATPPTYALQTSRVTLPIPEPSLSLLVTLGLGAFARRKRSA